MTTLTKNLNETLFTDLTSANAEAIQGGWALEAYNENGRSIAAANSQLPTLKYNNKATFIRVRSGTWRIYDLPNFQGPYRTLGVGSHNLSNYRWFNGSRFLSSTAYKDVSSLKKIRD